MLPLKLYLCAALTGTIWTYEYILFQIWNAWINDFCTGILQRKRVFCISMLSFSFNCINPKCVTRIEIDIPVLKDDKVINMFDHYTANECTTSLADNLPHIQNTLSLSVRSYIQKYYRSRTICEDNACAKTTKRLSLISRNGISVCRHCNKSILTKTYTESELYHQLSCFETIFDLPQILQTFKTLKIHHQSELFLAYAKLKELADKCVRCSAYNYINLQDFNFALRNMRANKI